MKKNSLLKVLFVSLIMCAGCACKMPFGTGKAVGTGNTRDPKSVCSYLNSLGFKASMEYKSSGGNEYVCVSKSSHALPAGRSEIFSYSATGDAENVNHVGLMMFTNSTHKDGGDGDNAFAQVSGELWQKVFSAPLPNDIKEAILANKGKNIQLVKHFSEPSVATVSRTPGSEGRYTLTLKIGLPPIG